MSNSKITAVRLEPEIAAKLAKIGEAMDRSQSWLIREAVRQFVVANAKSAKRAAKPAAPAEPADPSAPF